jgi:serine phosphatase RsbU (regulator of sigma subunit)
MAIPLGLIVAIMATDFFAPSEVHLGPLLVAAPAITPSFAGPRRAGLVGVLALGGQVLIAAHDQTLGFRNLQVEVVALAIVSLLVVAFAYLRELDRRKLVQVQSVSETAQRVVLRPLPARVGPLHVASVYLAAEAEAQIGGDLYGAIRSAGRTKVIVGDVRGKGLGAVSDAALLLGAFRETAHRQTIMSLLVADLERSLSIDLTDDPEGDEDAERFITAAVLDIPDDGQTLTMVNCGHPAPLIMRDGEVVELAVAHPSPPLGLGGLATPDYIVETFRFEVGDILLLYTDGVIEARNADGAFYPLADRVARWRDCNPESLLLRIREDLLAHAGGSLDDDAAMVAIQRLETREVRRRGPEAA